MPNRTYGLGDGWAKVIESLDKLTTVYDNLNKVISFDTDRRLRLECVYGRVGDGERVLDLGAGNGVFSKSLLESNGKVGDIVLLDVLSNMLFQAKQSLRRENVDMVIGVFEKLPFRSGVFDAALMGFALRDAINMDLALSEVRRILRERGKFFVVDLGKPDNSIKSWLVGFYWRIVAPVLAFIAIGKLGLEAISIYHTYKKLPKNSELHALVKRYFGQVELTEKLSGGAVVLRAA